MEKLIDYAIAYCKLGWSVMPITSEGKRKKALVSWTQYQKEKATEDQVRRWWSKYPNANIGIITGIVSGIIVIDIDSVQGRENYIAEFNQIHNTISQKTGKPEGTHLFFAHPGDQKYHNMGGDDFLKGVHIRADGGYVVVSPSIHENETQYRWIIDPTDMGLNDLLPLPDEVRKHLFAQTERKPRNVEGWVQEALMGVKEDYRNSTCTKLAGFYLRAFDGDAEQVEILLQNWNERNSPPLDWKEVNTVIKSVAEREGRNAMGDGVGEKIEKIQILEYPPPDDTRRYKIFLADHDGSVEMDVSGLVLFSRFKLKFTELVRRIPKSVKQPKWERMVNEALKEAEIIKMSVDETLTGLVLRMINNEVFSEYCANKLDHVRSQIVKNDDTIYLKIETLLGMMMVEREKVGRREVGKILRSLGFENELVRFKDKVMRCWQRKFDTEWKEKYRN